MLVDSLDLSEIESSYSSFGRPGYEPRMLVKVLLYGKMRGVRSGRELSKACNENLKFRFLSHNEFPDFRTLNSFRKRHSKSLAGLLRQTIEIGVREDFINLEEVCIDGTKLGAFAGRNSFKDPEELKAELDKLEEQIADSIKRDIELDKDEDDRFGGGSGESELPEDLGDKKKLAERIKEALKVHEATRGSKRKRLSTTDPECRFMKGKGINPGWNAQAAIDAKSRLIVAGYVTNATGDSSELIPVVDEIRENTGKEPESVIADRGYTANEQLGELKKRGIYGWVCRRDEPLFKFEYNSQTDSYRCPIGEELVLTQTWKDRKLYQSPACATCKSSHLCTFKNKKSKTRVSLAVSHWAPLVQEMKTRMQSQEGKRMKILRISTIEPFFGYIKYSKKLRQFAVRGLKFVNDMWKFELAAYNIERLCKMKMA